MRPGSLFDLSADLRYGLRALRKSPGFTTIVVLTLALGIGANTAIFSVVDAVLLRPLPFRDPARLVTAEEAESNGPASGLSARALLDWRAQNRVFEHMPGWANAGFNVYAAGRTERVDGMRVSWDYFETLGVSPALGRTFLPSDDRPDAPPVAVIGDTVWRQLFGADRGVVGRPVVVDGRPCTIAGVMPRSFRFFRFISALVSPRLLSGRAAVGLDARVLAFAIGLSLLTGVVFGIAPALRASRLKVRDALQEGGGRGWSGISTRGRFGRLLVSAEVALSLVLLAAGGLMIRSLLAMGDVDLGFRSGCVLTMSLAMSPQRFGGPAAIRSFYEQTLARAVSIPGVRSASIAMGQAPWDTPEATVFDIAGAAPPKPGEVRAAALERISLDYFRTMGMKLRQGRFFTADDGERAPRVAIVNQTLLAMHLPNEEPLGRLVVLGKDAWRIVGVVSDIKFGGPDAIHVPFLYLPMAQSPVRNGALALATAGDPMSVAQTVRAVVAQIDRETPVTKVKSLDRIVADSMSQPRVQTGLMAVLAALALALAALGIYGVLSYSVAQSTHELGIRMALGASAADVLRMVLGQGVLLTGAGLAVGFGGALALTGLLTRVLFQVKPTDPATFVAAGVLLGAVALAAAFVPAWRAARVDPAVAMRAE